MSGEELDLLDSAIARIEGPPFARISASGRAVTSDHSPYMPTRNAEETLRLMEKYIAKVVRMSDGSWAAIGPSGRACVGTTLSIAVCRAIVEAR